MGDGDLRWRHAAEDHRRAATLVAGIDGLPGIRVIRPAHPTNIVVAELDRLDVATAEAALAARGVLAIPFGPLRLRFVVYRGIDDDDIAHTIAACRTIAHDTYGTGT